MKANLLKTVSVLAGLVVFSACPGPKSNNNNNQNTAQFTVGPQGQIKAFGDDSTCDFSNGTIICHGKDLNQQICTSSTKNYDAQNLNNMCQQVSALHSEALQPNGCNFSGATSRVLSEYCSNSGVQPNPINPINPIMPPAGRLITCKATYNGSFPTLMPPIQAYSNGKAFSFMTITERRGGVLGFLGIGRKIGEVRVSYISAQGKIPETLTATVKYEDRKTKRNVFVKHSGFAGSAVKLDTTINGANITISCNDNLNTRVALNEVSNLVCVGSTHTVGSEYEENIQFIRPLNSIVSGEEIQVTEAVGLSLDKATSMLTLRTNIDTLLGPAMTSSSSLRSDALVEATEGLGKAKITCSIK